jgi:type IV secretory pathway TraG/TraD family ATPase VirD4
MKHNEQEWGRREATIWPPSGPVNSYAALFLSLLVAGMLLYLRLSFALTPLQRYTLPTYIETALSGSIHAAGKYQMLSVSDDNGHHRPVVESDLMPGRTRLQNGKILSHTLSNEARQSGLRHLYLSPLTSFNNRGLHAYLRRWVYDDAGLRSIFLPPLWWGGAALLVSLPFAIVQDIKRKKILRYGRRLKGPVMTSPKDFNQAVRGDGIGILTDGLKEPLRIPEGAQDKHIAIIGDTGTGKTSIILQVLEQIAIRGESAIIYDPACEFVQRFYDPKRGDIVLNPLDARCPYWSPSDELVRTSEAKTIAVSLYQPTTDKKGEFFVESPQKIFAHLLTFLPTPAELLEWMSRPEEIDRRVKGTELAALIDPRAPQQRSGVLASLGLIADSLKMLPTEADCNGRWTATNWVEHRKGWIFLTSLAPQRESLRPLISLWIDLLILRLLNAPKPGQRPVWFLIDELASLQRLPQLHTAITENRKTKNPIVLGFQGKAQVEVNYGHLAEVMLSQPATKIYLKTSEPKAAKWVSEALGEIEVERLKETRFDGHRAGKNFALDRQSEPLVMPSEIEGLADLKAFLKYRNHVVRFSFPYLDIPIRAPGFVERAANDLIDRTKPRPEPVASPTSSTRSPQSSSRAKREPLSVDQAPDSQALLFEELPPPSTEKPVDIARF